jgi:hypothetical protein
MKHFALVGLFVALVTVRVEAQTSLFDVVVDLNAKTATITANSNVSPSILGVNATTQTLASELITTDGITFINLFGGGVSSILPSTATSGYEITLGSNSLSAYFPNEFTLNNVYSDLTKGVIYTGGFSAQGESRLSGRTGNQDQSLNQDALSYGNPRNQGSNLLVFAAANPIEFVMTGFAFSGTAVLDFSNYASVGQQITLGTGPHYVYAGANSLYSGDSFLGTYTLTVVPEPSTYAAIAGGLGLAAAVIHRRRQRAKAAQG